MPVEQFYDYVIVGGGTAGCVLAARLSSKAHNKVLLIEAGRDTPPGATPANILDIFPSSQADPAYYWPGLTADLGKPPSANDAATSAKPYWVFAQARVMGGGGRVMGLVALRGMPDIYDGWRKEGCDGWGWDDVLPYFKRVERDLDFNGPMHGQDGPIPIRRVQPNRWPPFARAAGEALKGLGYDYIDDLNGSGADGFSSLPKATTPQQRVSSAQGYLDAAVRARPNLRILSEALVERILFDGQRASGVAVRQGDDTYTFAAQEVILSAGAIQSPAPLLRSGIGPAAALAQLGMVMRADLPGVGANLQNHPLFAIAVHLRPYARQPKSMREMCVAFMRYSSGYEGCSPGDMSFNAVNVTGTHALARATGAVGAAVYKPFSRGSVTLRSADINASPDVRFNALTDPRDMARMTDAMASCLRVASSSEVASTCNQVFFPDPVIARRLSQPTVRALFESSVASRLFDASNAARRHFLGGMSIDPVKLLEDSAALRELVLQQTSVSGHVAGTCRMGAPSDPRTVVDSHCRVIGVSGLRVVDASLMPTLVSANTNLPTQMIAEKASDLILTHAT